jgi:hypothetical protein
MFFLQSQTDLGKISAETIDPFAERFPVIFYRYIIGGLSAVNRRLQKRSLSVRICKRHFLPMNKERPF